MTIQSILNKIADFTTRIGLGSIGKSEFFQLLVDMTNKIGEVNDNVNSVAKSLIWQDPVNTFADLATTYPTPELGWAALVKAPASDGNVYVYSWNGTAWKSTGLKNDAVAETAVNNANAAALNAIAAANAGGSPKSTYANLTALQSAYPTGTTGIYVLADTGHWRYWNGSSWADGGLYLSALPSGIRSQLISTTPTSKLLDDELNKTVATTELMNGTGICYKHPRGDSEFVGNATYTQNGIGMWCKPTGLMFSRILLKAACATAGTTVYIRISKSAVKPDYGFAVANLTTIQEITQVWDNDSTATKTIDLNTPATILSTDYIVIQVATKTNVKVILREWSTNPNSDRLGFLLSTSSNYSTQFTETWNYSDSAYEVTPVLQLVYPFVNKTEYTTQVALLQSKKDGLTFADYAANEIVSYRHPNSEATLSGKTPGDSESNGDTTYEYYGMSFICKPTRNIFNKIQLKASLRDSAGTVHIRLYKSLIAPDYGFNVSNLTFITEVTQVWDVMNLSTKTINLDSPITVENDMYVYILLSTLTSNKVIAAAWQNDPNTNRVPFVYSYSTNYASQFTETWYRSPNYCAAPILTYNSLAKNSALEAEMLNIFSGVDIVLADTIHAVVGDTLQLYFRDIIKAVNPYVYDILVTCTKGSQYPRFFEYTPVLGDVGTTTFNIQVKTNSGYVLASKTVNLITKAVIQSPALMKHFLGVGDSGTTAGQWVIELSRRLIGTGGTPAGAALSNIALVGRKVQNGVGWEGTGGWSWGGYTTTGSTAYRFYVTGVTTPPSIGAGYMNNGVLFTVDEINITGGSGNFHCIASGAPQSSGVLTKSYGSGDASITFNSYVAETGNPFWYNGALDFTHYVNTYCGGTIECVMFYLGVNSITPNQIDFSSIITTAKIIIDHIHTCYPNCKVKIMGNALPTLQGGMGANYGALGTGYADAFGIVRSLFELQKAYQAWCNNANYVSFMEYIGVTAEMDSENNLPVDNFAVNTRNPLTEKRSTNGFHVNDYGYGQIADSVFRNIIANYCQ